MNIIIRSISSLDTFQVFYLTSSLHSIPFFQFTPTPQKQTVCPSVISQVTYSEITIDPYLKSLSEDYYFPLSLEMTSNNMLIDSNGTAAGEPPISPALGATTTVLHNNQKITIEDSLEAISDLIAEIQAADDIELPPANTSTPIPAPTASTGKTHPSPFRFLLPRQKQIGGSSMNSLPLLRKFFHVLLSTKAVSILPVFSNSKASPMKTTTEVNELHATSAKIFFKASKSNGSLVGAFHISSTLSFEEFSSNEKILY